MHHSLKKDIQRSTRRIGRNANIAFRAERTISRRRFAVVRTQTSLLALAGLAVGIGIIMFSVAVFFWIAETVGKANAGLILAAADFVLAGILVAVALRMTAEPELEALIEVRDMALADIEAELEDAFGEVTEIADNIREITRNPLGALTGGLAAPLIAALLKALKADTEQQDPSEGDPKA